MKRTCSRCNGSTFTIIQKYDAKSKVGFQTFAVPCPECRPEHYRKPVYDFKLAASGETIQ